MASPSEGRGSFTTCSAFARFRLAPPSVVYSPEGTALPSLIVLPSPNLAIQYTVMANHVWTEPQKQFVRDNAARLKDWELAAALSRITGRTVTIHALRKCRQGLGIWKKQGRGLCEVVRFPEQDNTAGRETVRG